MCVCMLYMCVFGAAEREEGIIIEGEEEARLAAVRISQSPLREGPGKERAADASPRTKI